MFVIGAVGMLIVVIGIHAYAFFGVVNCFVSIRSRALITNVLIATATIARLRK